MTENEAAIRDAAWAKGLTRIVHMTCDAGDYLFWVTPDEDLDAAFHAVEADTGRARWVNGWLWELHDGADERSALYAAWGDFRELPRP